MENTCTQPLQRIKTKRARNKASQAKRTDLSRSTLDARTPIAVRYQNSAHSPRAERRRPHIAAHSPRLGYTCSIRGAEPPHKGEATPEVRGAVSPGRLGVRGHPTDTDASHAPSSSRLTLASTVNTNQKVRDRGPVRRLLLPQGQWVCRARVAYGPYES